MKPVFVAMAALLLLTTSCGTRAGSAGVVSEGGLTDVTDISLLANVQMSDSTYLITHQIDSLEVFVHDSLWGYFSSDFIDTALISKTTAGSFFESKRKQNYHFVAVRDRNDLLTAGDYSDFLNGFNNLPAGHYMCLIRSFQVVDINGNRETYYPYHYEPFFVEQGVGSVFVGEITLNL